jgi:hypothetical protein
MKRILPLVLAALALPAGAAALDTSAFAKTVEFAVTGYAGSSALENFPVLVRLAADSPAGFDYADCAADGSDLRFADADGNLIPHEIDTWNAAGESLVWVRVPSLANGAAFSMYFGSDAPGGAAAEDVWSRYAVVIHGGSSAANAVSGGPAVTIGNATYVKAEADAGKVGGGFRKSAGNAVAVNVAMGNPAASLADTGKFSVSGWFKRNGNGGNSGNGTHVLAASRPGWNNGDGFLLLQEKGSYIDVAAKNSHQWDGGNYTLANQTWGHVAFSYEKGVAIKSYFDGNADQTKTSPGNLVSSGETWTFGSYANTGSNDSFIGDMDELRVFDGVASGDWIKAEHDSVANASFLACGDVHDAGSSVRASTLFFY